MKTTYPALWLIGVGCIAIGKKYSYMHTLYFTYRRSVYTF